MKKTLGLLLLLGMLFLTFPKFYLAEENTLDFYISPVFSKNQREDVTTLFDIDWHSKAVEKIAVVVTNNSNEKMSYSLTIGQAITNGNGVIDYVGDTNESNTFLSMVSFPKTIEVEANSKQEVVGEIRMPKDEFKGLILGGIKVTPIVEKTAKSGITNVFSYSLPIALRGEVVEETSTINLLEVTTNQVSNKNVLASSLTLDHPVLLKETKAEIKVYKKGDKEPIFSEEKMIDFAPNAAFSLNSFIQQAFKSGKYVMNMTLTHGEDTWNLEKEFEISKEESKTYNAGTTEASSESSFMMYLILLMVVLLLVIAILIIILLKRNKK